MKNNRLYKIAAFALGLIMSSVSMAQNGINAPFSQYGVGEGVMPYNMPFASSMGGAVIGRHASNSVNPFNPASYAKVESQSFVFDMGLSIDMTTLKDPQTSLYDADGNVAYVTVAFPLSRWWKTSLGLMPFSNVNYESVYEDPISPVKTKYEGVGGVSQLYWGHGFNITKRLSLGFNASYLFGSIVKGITFDQLYNDSLFTMDSRRQKDTYIKNFLFDFGLQYDQPLGDDYSLGVGLTLKPHQKMSITDNSLIYTFISKGLVETIVDTIFPTNGASSEYTSSLEQPLTLGLGLTFSKNNKWMIASDVVYSPWSGLKYEENSDYNIFGHSALQYGNNMRYALGYEWTGDKSATKYFKRISWRAGVHYESGKLLLSTVDPENPMEWNQHAVNEFGMGMGMSLPMRKGRSAINISMAWRSMGSQELLRRNCFSIGISVGSCDQWFVKRKYN